jgi:hypothetical protein
VNVPFDIPLQRPAQRRGLRLATDHSAEHPDHAQDLQDAAMIEEVHFDSGPCEFRSNVGLQVREAQDEIGRTVKPEIPTMRRASPH